MKFHVFRRSSILIADVALLKREPNIIRPARFAKPRTSRGPFSRATPALIPYLNYPTLAQTVAEPSLV
jgi:hypothetical protein